MIECRFGHVCLRGVNLVFIAYVPAPVCVHALNLFWDL